MKKFIVLIPFLFFNISFLFSQVVIIKENKIMVEGKKGEINSFRIDYNSIYLDTLKHLIFTLRTDYQSTIDNLGCPCVNTLSKYKYTDDGALDLIQERKISLVSKRINWYHLDSISDLDEFSPFFKIKFNQDGNLISELILNDINISFLNKVKKTEDISEWFTFISNFLKKEKKYLRKQGFLLKIY